MVEMVRQTVRRIPSGIFTVEPPTCPPLTARERSALIRILGQSSDDAKLAPRRKAALDAYLDVLSTPPLIPDEVITAARALIRVWAEVGQAKQPELKAKDPTVRPQTKRHRTQPIFAKLLDLDPNVEACTEQLSPVGLTNVFEQFGYR